MSRVVAEAAGTPGGTGGARAPGPIRYATSRDGTRIAWTTWGTGPSLIFVPPWPETIETGFFHALLRRSFGGRVVIYDRRGFGRSDWGVDHALELYADDLEAVADAAGIDRITLWGQAAGAFESVVLAARTPRVARMLLLDPAFRAGQADLPAQRSLYALLDHDLATFWRAFVQFLMGWGEKADIERLVSYYLSATNLADIRAMLNLIMHRADLSTYAPLVQAECLLIHNADDSLMPPTAAAHLARLLPHQRLLITSGARFNPKDPPHPEVRSFLDGGRAGGETAPARDGFSPKLGKEGSELTHRELEVLELVVTGATNEEIAARLWLSKGTVARHLANVYTKLGVRNRVEATTWAMGRVRE